MAGEADRPGGARGRRATAIAEIPPAGWKDILWRSWREVGEDHIMLVAAGVTFYGLLALVPAMTAIVSIYGIFADPQSLERQIDLLTGLVPSDALSVVHDQLRRLVEQRPTKLGVTTAVSLAIALWSANAGMKAMFEAMNIAYGEEEKRSYLRLTAVTLAATLGAIAAILAAIALGVVLPVVLRLVGLGMVAQIGARVGGLLLVVLLLMLAVAVLYRWGPSRETAKWRWITPGGVLAIVVILAVSGAFTWYVAYFDSYNATYGSLGAIFGFMTLLWINAIVLIVGAELNAEIEHQTEHDTTTGRPRPMGERGAVMADTVGRAFGGATDDGSSGKRLSTRRDSRPS